MTGVEEGKDGSGDGGNSVSVPDNVQQNGTTEKAPVVTGTNMETLPRPGKQSDPSTAFLRAARAGQLEKVLEFLESGVDINASNANGLNALHLAAKDGHLEIVRELLTRGATVDAATKKGNTALHIASLAGQEEVVQLLVQRGASVNAQSQNGFTPLYMAAQENHDSVVRFLLGKGANQTLATEDGFTPLAVAMQQGHDKVVAVLLENDTRGKVRLPALHIAAKKDDCKAAALLLQNDHNPDVTSKSGFTPLHIAAHYGNDRIASLLYDKGADVNFAAKHNITPMHVAAKWGKIKMVNLLMSKGANIAAKTRDGLTPLHCAARAGHHEVVDILIEKGAPIGAKTKNGLAPLHMASQGDHVDAARILLYHRAPVDEVTVDYLTALHVAAHCGHVRVAKLLLDRNADPNARALNGFTPLHIACKKNRIKVVELLLKHKASIEATTESGLTPLHVASFMGCMNIVIYLLQNEASPDIPTVRGETPLHLAARANQTDIIRILLRNGAQVDARAREEQTPLHVASRLGNVDIVMLLLQHGADVDATTKDLYTPLHIAAKEGQEEVASVLLDNGASLNAMTKKGFTPLHLAAKYGNMNVARLLLQKNAPVDAQGKNGVTPLHVASHYDHQNVALLLLDKGASPHAMAKNGHTPLHIAARKNQMDIATTLLEYGAKANAESKAGFTPLHLSAQEGHTDMSTLLIEHKADTNHKAKNGLTPLHLCAQEDKVNVATILVKNGAQVDAKTKAGYTPLHVACHFGQVAMVRFLLRAGTAVDSSTGAGYTPLHQAAQQGHSLVINLLLESKAKANAVTNNGQTALAIAQKLGYISVVETLKVVTETVITTTQMTTVEEKYRVQAPESMQETFMSDSEDEGGGDEIGIAAMNVYGQPTHAQHVYLPSYYQGQMTYTREDPMLSDQQQYRYMTVDDMKSMGDDSMRVNVTDDERDNRHSGGTIVTDLVNKESCYRSNTTNVKPDNIDINRHPVHVGPSLESLNWSLAALGIVPKGQGMWRDSIPSWRNFLVSFLVDARGGAMRGCRHSGVRVIVPPRKAAMPMRITCRYLKRDKLTNPPPLMEGEALASRILELGPVGAKFLGPVIIEVPHFASLRGKEREIVILRSDNGETWREHTLEASEEAVQDVLNESFEGEELSQLEDLQTSRIVRILTVDFPHYFAVVSRIRQEVHAVGPEGGTVSSSAVPQVQAVFPPAALTKKIRVGLQAHPIPAELVAKLLGNRVAVSPIVTVEPRRRKFHKPITLTIPVPQAANKGMINQYSGDAPTLRLLCSITGGQSRAVWEDVTGSTPLTFVKDCVSFTTTVSARFWLMDCRNITEATRMATELYTHATHVPFMAKFVVFAKLVDPLEARLRVFCMTDDKEDKTLEHQEHFTEVAKSRDVEALEGKTQYMEFAGNLVPVLKSGEQLQLPFRAFKENRVPFTVRIKDPDAADMVGRIMFMSEPKVVKGEPPQTPICTLNILLPEKISPETGHSELDLLESSKNYSFLRDGGSFSNRPEIIYKAVVRLTDIANLLDSDWEKLAEELNISPNDIDLMKKEHPGKPALQAAMMFKLWQGNGNKITGNTLEEALNKIGREDIVKKCIFNVEPVTDDVEEAVARVRLDQPGFDSLKDELGPSRDSSLRRDGSLVDQKLDFEESDHMRDSESVEDLTNIGNVPIKQTKQQHIKITNGTVFNGTSTPVKDKYASEEKDLTDDMAEFLEHKYHVTEKMTKKSRNDVDDDNKNRQRVIEDANKLVFGVLQDAEKEKEKLMMEGSGVYRDGGKEAGGAIGVYDDDQTLLAQDIKGIIVKETKTSEEESIEPVIIRERKVIDDPRKGKVISKTVVTTTKGHPDDGTVITKTTTVRETITPGQMAFFGANDPVIGLETSQKSVTPTEDSSKVVVTKTIITSGSLIDEKTTTTTQVITGAPDTQTVAFGTNVPTDLVKDQAKSITRIEINSGKMSADDRTSEKERRSQEEKEVADKSAKSTEKPSKDLDKKSKSPEKDPKSKQDQKSPEKKIKKTDDDVKKSAYKDVYNVDADIVKDDGKKKEKGGIFSGIFKGPKLKKVKSKDSREISIDSGDEEVKTVTKEFLEDTQKVAEEIKQSPSYPAFDPTNYIAICPQKLPENEPHRDPIWSTSDFLYDARRNAELFVPESHVSIESYKKDESVSKKQNTKSVKDLKSPEIETEEPEEHDKEKHGFFSSLFKGTKKIDNEINVGMQDTQKVVETTEQKMKADVKDVEDVEGKIDRMKKTINGVKSTAKDEVDTDMTNNKKIIDDIDAMKKSIKHEGKEIDKDLKHLDEKLKAFDDKIKHKFEDSEKAVEATEKSMSKNVEQSSENLRKDDDNVDEVKEKSGGFFGIFKSPKTKDKKRSRSKEKESTDVSLDSEDEEMKTVTKNLLEETKKVAEKVNKMGIPEEHPKKQIDVKVEKFVSTIQKDSDLPTDKLKGTSYDVKQSIKKTETIITTTTTTKTTENLLGENKDNGHTPKPSEDKLIVEVATEKIDKAGKRISGEFSDSADEGKHKGFFSMFKSPKLKNKKKDRSRDRSSSKEPSFDSGDEELRQATSTFLEDTRKTADIIGEHKSSERRKSFEDSVKERTVSPVKVQKQEPSDVDTAVKDEDKQKDKDKDPEKGGIFGFLSPKGSHKRRSKSREKSSSTDVSFDSGDEELRTATTKFLDDSRNIAAIMEEHPYPSTPKKNDYEENDSEERRKNKFDKVKDKSKDEEKSKAAEKGGFFGGIFKSAKHVVEEVADDAKEFWDATTEVEKTKQQIERDLKYATDTEDKVTDEASKNKKDMKDIPTVTKNQLQQVVVDRKDAKREIAAIIEDRIVEDTNAINKTAGDVKKTHEDANNTTDSISKEINGNVEQIQIKNLTDTVVNSVESVKNEATKETKKVEEKSKGFLSGIFKGVKHAADEVVEDVKNFVDDTKQEAQQEEAKMKREAENAKKSAEQTGEKVAAGIESKREKILDSFESGIESIDNATQQIKDAEKSKIERNKEIIINKTKDAQQKLTDAAIETDKAVKHITEHIDDNIEKTTDKIRSAKDKIDETADAVADNVESAKDKAAKETKKAKEKSKGFFSGIFKGVKHAADGVVDDVKDFVDATKKESQEEEVKIKQVTGDAKNTTTDVKDKAVEALSRSADHTGENLQENYLKRTEDSVEREIKKDTLIAKEIVEEGVKTTKESLQKGVLGLESKVDNAKGKINKEAAEMGETIGDKAQKVAEDIDEASKSAIKSAEDKIKSAKDKIDETADSVADSVESTKDKVAKESKKAKEKSKGFFSGIFKGVKHAADEVVEDVKDFVDETRKEAQEEEVKIKHAATDAGKTVEDVLQDSKKEVTGAVKSIDTHTSRVIDKTEKAITEIPSETSQAAKEVVDKVKDNLERTKDSVEREIKKDTLIAKEIVEEGVKTTEQGIQKGVLGLESKVDNARSEIIENVAKMGKTVDDKAQKVAEDIDEASKSAIKGAEDKIKSAKDKIDETADSVAESVESAKDKAAKETKKTKEKSKGFFSGIFKGVKHAADEVVEDVKDFVDETRKEAQEEEVKIKHAATDAGKTVEDVLQDSKTEVSGAVKSIDTHTSRVIDKTVKAVTEIPSETSQAAKEVVDKVEDNLKRTKDSVEREIKKDTLIAKELVVEGVKTTEQGIQKGVLGLESKVDNARSEIIENVAKMGKTVDDKAQKVAEDIDEASKSAIKGAEDKIKSAKDKIDETADSVADSVDSTKDKVAKKTKKAKEKNKGFFSGIFKGVKHAADEVVEDVKDFVDETRKEAQEEEVKIKHAATDAGKTVEDVLQDSKKEVTGAVKSIDTHTSRVIDKTEKAITEIPSETSQAAKEVVDKVKDNLERTKDSVEREIKKDTLIAKEIVEEGVKTTKESLQKGVLGLESKVDNAKGKINKEAAEMGETIGNKAQKVAEDIDEASKSAIKSAEDKIKSAKDKIDGTADSVADSVESAKDRAAKETKKAKEKSKGFFSGIFKGVKHAADEVVEDVKDFVDETRKEAQEEEVKIKHAATDAGKTVEDVLQDSKKEVTGAVKSIDTHTSRVIDKTEKAITEIPSETSQAAKEVVDKVKDNLERTKDSVEREIKKDTLIAKEIVEEGVKTTEQGIQKGVLGLESKVDNARSEIIENVAKMGKTVDDKAQKVAEDIDEASKSAIKGAEDKIKSAKDKIDETVDSVADSVESAKDKAAKETKKAKEKNKGFFSGIFKGVKHAADEAVEDVKDFVDETRKEAQEEEVKIKEVIGDTKNATTDLKEKAVEELSHGVDHTGDNLQKNYLKRNEDSVEREIKNDTLIAKEIVEEGVKTTKESLQKGVLGLESKVDNAKGKINKEAAEMGETIGDKAQKVAEDIDEASKSAIKSAEDKIKSAKDKIDETADSVADSVESTKDKVAKESKKAKEKSKGFFSGIFKGVKHAADEVVDDVKDFVDETRKEAQEEEVKIKHAVTDAAKTVDGVLQDSKKEVTGAVKSIDTHTSRLIDKTEKAITEIPSETSQAAKEVVDKVEDNLKRTKDSVEREIKKDTLIAKELVVEGVKTTEQGIQKGVLGLESKVDNARSEIIENVAKMGKTVDDKAQKVAEDIDEASKSTIKGAEDKIKSAKDKIDETADSVADSVESAKDRAAKETKKAKEKSKGFFSGIFKGVKHAADEVVDDVKDFVDDTKQEAQQEKAKMKQAAEDGGYASKSLIDTFGLSGNLEKNVKHQTISDSPRDFADAVKTNTDNNEAKLISNKNTVEEVSLVAQDKNSYDADKFYQQSDQGTKKTVADRDISGVKEFLNETRRALTFEQEEIERAAKISSNSIEDDIHSRPIKLSTSEIAVEYDVFLDSKNPNIHPAIGIDSVKKGVDSEVKKVDATQEKVEKESKKVKEKGVGFFSGIVKGVQHAVDEVTEEVKEFWDETKEEAKKEETEFQRAIYDVDNKASTDIQTAKEKLVTKITDTTKDVSHSTKAAKDHTKAKIIAGKDAATTSLKSTGKKIVKGAEKAAKSTKDATKQASGDVKKIKDLISHDAQGDTKQVKEKNSTEVEKVTENVEAVKSNVEEQGKKIKEKSSGMIFGILKRPKHPSEEVDDVEQSSDKVEEKVDNQKNKEVELLNKDTEESIKDTKKMKKSAKDEVKTNVKDVKQAKEKSGGFLSDIIKGAKHTVEEVTEEVKEFWDETKEEAKEEEERLRKQNEEVGKIVKDAKSKAPVDVLDDEEDLRRQMILDLEQSVEQLINETSPFPIERSPSSSQVSSPRLDRSSRDSTSPSEPTSVQSTLERGPSPEKSKSKSKSKGVISSIVKGAKSASHKIVKEVDHAAESIRDATEKFLEDTKVELKDSQAHGSYDVSSPLHDSDDKTRESDSNVKLESFSKIGKVDRDQSPMDSKVKSVSRIPQKVSPPKEMVKEIRVVRIKEKSSSKDKLDEKDDLSNLGHLEPRARQSVTTVVTKSVRTAAATPPPIPDELGDISIKDVTEEAAKRAQVLADEASAAGKPGHDSAEIDGTVERHVTSPTKQPVPAPRHCAKSSSTTKMELTLELRDSARLQYHQESKSPKSKIPEPIKAPRKSRPIVPVDSTVNDVNQKSKIPVFFKESKEKASKKDQIINTIKESNQDSIVKMVEFSEACILDDKQPSNVQTKTVTTIMTEEINPNETEKLLRSQELSRALEDISVSSEKLEEFVESSSYVLKATKTVINERVPIPKSKDERVSEESTFGSTTKETVRSISTKSSWDSSRSKDDQDNWDQIQFSLDTPSSGDAGIAKNSDSRQDLSSDSDSEGSTRPRRRSLSKRRTLGSSSGSDVALHEGAELSPLEDDQESDFLQTSEPSYTETTTTEIDPSTNDRITRTTRTITSSIISTGELGGPVELRDSMQKMVDRFMTEERSPQ